MKKRTVIPGRLLAAMALLAGLPVSGAHAQAPLAEAVGHTALSAGGDAARGRQVFYRCKACHALAAEAGPAVGPHLEGLFGRRAGGVADFARYSAALREADFVWTEDRLDAWMQNPQGFLPGNKMAFAGVRHEQDRKDLIAYLRQLQKGTQP